MHKYFIGLLLLFFSSKYVISQTKTFIDQPYVEVNGSADTLVTPDEIFIKIVISEKDTKDKISVEEQEKKMLTSFALMKIDIEKSLTVNDMSSNFKFHRFREKDILKTKEYVLKVSSAEWVNKVFAGLENIGLSNVSIYKVQRSDLEYLKNICRMKAVKNAQAKAIALAVPLQQSIGNAILITDNEPNFVYPLYRTMSVGAVADANQENNESIIDFEKIKIEASVGVKFLLK